MRSRVIAAVVLGSALGFALQHLIVPPPIHVHVTFHQHLTDDASARYLYVCRDCVLHLDGHHLDVETLQLDGQIVP